jgi:hypothetical protein
VSVSSTHAPGDVFPIGTSTVTYTFTDAAGNSDATSFTVTVVDNTNPVISGNPGNMTVYTGAGRTTCNQTATWTAPTATDNCTSPVSVSSTHAPGDVFPIGTSTVTYTFTDAAGNSDATSFTVTVVDNTNPVIACPPAQFNCYNEAGYTIPDLTATDNCGIATSVYSITGATIRKGSGNNPGKMFNPGVSIITWTVTDIRGNVSTCTTSVTINPKMTGTVPDVTATPQGTSANTVYVGYTPASVLSYTAYPTGGTAPYTYSWSVSGNLTINGTSTANVVNVTNVLPSASTGTLKLVITDNKGCTQTITKTIDIVDVRSGIKNDKVSICHDGNGISVDGHAVSAHLAHGDYLGTCLPSLIVAQPAATQSVSVAQLTPVQELNVIAPAINVYPNPSNGQFTVQLKNFSAFKATIMIMDQSGKAVSQKEMQLTFRLNTISFNLSNHAAGKYYLKVISADGLQTAQVVIQR